jgi:hypothetical protein
MNDVTMCINHNCVKRAQCYRYRVSPSKYRQSYADFKTCPDSEYNFYMPVWNSFKQHLKGGAE